MTDTEKFLAAEDHARIAATLTGHDRRCYEAVAAQGAAGATAHECVDMLQQQYPEITETRDNVISSYLSRLVSQKKLLELSSEKRPSRINKLSAVYVTVDRKGREPESKWRRVSVSLILRVLKDQSYEVYSSHGVWYLELPGEPRQQFGSFEKVLEALARYVKAREHGKK
jgi:hypothetical protein